MLTITTGCGVILTGSTDVELAVEYGKVILKPDWEEGLCPFEEHTIFHQLVEEVYYLLDLQSTN